MPVNVSYQHSGGATAESRSGACGASSESERRDSMSRKWVLLRTVQILSIVLPVEGILRGPMWFTGAAFIGGMLLPAALRCPECREAFCREYVKVVGPLGWLYYFPWQARCTRCGAWR